MNKFLCDFFHFIFFKKIFDISVPYILFVFVVYKKLKAGG